MSFGVDQCCWVSVWVGVGSCGLWAATSWVLVWASNGGLWFWFRLVVGRQWWFVILVWIGGGSAVDMANRLGRVGSSGCGSKRVILSGLKRVRVNQVAGQVGLSWPVFFTWIFFFIKKTTFICHLESHATNYLMQNALLWIHHLYHKWTTLINTYSIIFKLYKS